MLRRCGRHEQDAATMPRHLALLLLLAAAPAAAETPAELHRLAAPAGLGKLIRPDGVANPPLVVMLPDALGEDGRSEPYVGSLLARGIASLVLGLGADTEIGGPDTDPAADPAAVPPVLGWAAEAGFDAGRIGLMGFGLGGRAALAAADAAAPMTAAALYPGCAALPVPAAAPALVLQGADAAAGCEALDGASRLTVRLLGGAGHGWDAPGAIWPTPGPVLPDPAMPGGPRLRARADLAVTLEAAETIAEWFEQRLSPDRMRAAR
jgi:dienelactone hydrolase